MGMIEGESEGSLCCLCEIRMMDMDQNLSRTARLNSLKEDYDVA
jgi:hypothetical protein